MINNFHDFALVFLNTIQFLRCAFYVSIPVFKYYNWRRVMELSTIEQLNLQASPSEIEDWVERFELWCSVQKSLKADNLSALFLTAGGRELYSLPEKHLS